MNILLLDDNAHRITFFQNGLKQHKLTICRHAKAAMKALKTASFDVILANPPYYANSWIAQMFIEKSKSLLRPGGRFHLVTKMVNHVAPFMADVFPDSTWEERRGYHVLRGDVA